MLVRRPVEMGRDLNRIAKSSRVAEAKASTSAIRRPHVMHAARPCPGAGSAGKRTPKSLVADRWSGLSEPGGGDDATRSGSSQVASITTSKNRSALLPLSVIHHIGFLSSNSIQA